MLPLLCCFLLFVLVRDFGSLSYQEEACSSLATAKKGGGVFMHSRSSLLQGERMLLVFPPFFFALFLRLICLLEVLLPLYFDSFREEENFIVLPGQLISFFFLGITCP